MKFSYYYLPNSLVEKKMLPSDFAVAAFLYSMAQAYGNKNLYGIYVKAPDLRFRVPLRVDADFALA